MINNVVSDSGVKSSESVLFFSNFFRIEVITECFEEFQVLYNGSLVIYFKYSSVYMSTRNSQYIPWAGLLILELLMLKFSFFSVIQCYNKC